MGTTRPEPIRYPTTKEEAEKWGFDEFKPVGTPMAWITDWMPLVGARVPRERIRDVVAFKIDMKDMSTDDIVIGLAEMYKLMWHGIFSCVEELWGKDKALELARKLGDTFGYRGWGMLQERFGKPVPPDKIAWYQDIAHLLYGPDTHAYAWYDDEKAVCTRKRCLFRPPPGMEKNAIYCRAFDTAYIEAYMRREPTLDCKRPIDLGEDGKGPKCIHVWKYKKK